MQVTAVHLMVWLPLQEKCDWVEKFVRLGAGPVEAARNEHSRRVVTANWATQKMAVRARQCRGVLDCLRGYADGCHQSVQLQAEQSRT